MGTSLKQLGKGAKLHCIRCDTVVGTIHDKMVPIYCAECKKLLDELDKVRDPDIWKESYEQLYSQDHWEVGDALMPIELDHTHTGCEGWWYAGMSAKAPGYHLYVCQGSNGEWPLECPVTMIIPCRKHDGGTQCPVCKAERLGVGVHTHE